MTQPNSTAVASARRRARRVDRRGWLLSAPSTVVMVLLTVVPLVTVLVGAFSPTGWHRLQTIAKTPGFTRTLENTVIWVIVGTAGALILGVVAALALQHRSVRRPGLWRSLLIIPWATPTVVAATAWKWFYNRDYGMLNGFLQSLGLIDEPVSWLANTSIALYAVALVQVWVTFPFVMLMTSAALQSIPVELYEAARMDGANAMRSFWSITVPSMRDSLFVVALIVTVWTVNAFLPVWVMTKGGPAGATNIIPVQLYQYFLSGDKAAIYVLAAIQLIFSMAIAGLYVQRTQKETAS
jgi:multiple sugar transport system permease protein